MPRNPNAQANLVRLPRGTVLNPNGRPKGSRNRSTILREILALERKTKNPLTDKTETIEVEREMELAIVKKAIKGDVSAYNAVKDNAYGKLTNTVEVVNNELSNADFALELLRRMVSEFGWSAAQAIIGVRQQFPDVEGEILEIEARTLEESAAETEGESA